MRKPCHLSQKGLHGLLDRRILDARVGLEHDLGRVTRSGREPRLEDVERLLRLGSREREVHRIGAAKFRPCESDPYEGHDPDRDHPPPIAIAPTRQLLEHECPPGFESSKGWNLGEYEKFPASLGPAGNFCACAKVNVW